MINIVKKPTSVGETTLGTSAVARTVMCAQSLVSKNIADLQWQIKFTQMKLNHWDEPENCKWMNLVRLQEHAKRELLVVAS
jgi:hypothetical protein